MDFLAAIGSFLIVFAVLWAVMSAVLPRALRGLRRFSKRLADPVMTRFNVPWHSAKPYAPVLLVFVAGTMLLFWAADGFLDLVEVLQANSPVLLAIDQRFYDFFKERRSDELTAFFIFFTLVGTPVVLGILSGVACVMFLFTRRYRWAAYLAVTSIVGGLMNVGLKHYFDRPRPDLALALRSAHGSSFPSGHAMGSIIVFGALAYLAFRTVRRWRNAAAILAAAITIVVAIALSRVYLGVHWISDIAAGLTIGAVWVVFTTTTYEVFRRIRLLRKRKLGE